MPDELHTWAKNLRITHVDELWKALRQQGVRVLADLLEYADDEMVEKIFGFLAILR